MNRTTRYVLAGSGSLVLVGSLALVSPATALAAGTPKPFTATAVSPTSVVTSTAKSDSGKLATSDSALVARTDAALVNVVVKLDYDAPTSYKGGLKGLAATSPKVTGKKLTGQSAAEKAYAGYTGSVDSRFRSALASKLPAAKAGNSLTTVYGGVALRIPANQAKTLLALPGVAAVQSDALQHTNAIPEGPQFIGAPTIWKQTGGQALAGKGVIFADLDTGIWPEHPMLADNPALGTPPGAPSGVARPCEFGDNPLTSAVDVFQCNHKVIGGKAFLTTYNANNPGEVYPTTARDSDGHGTHTTTTAAGDPVQSAVDLGVDRGPISGVAPGAWVLEYKVCGAAGCYAFDSAAAVGQAIEDGADVINFSISGGAQPFTDPVELAFLDAYNAGVFVAASAGNSGPGAGTTDHHGPWVTTVAASTQERAFTSTLTVTGDGASATFEGTTLTDGVTAATPIVLAQNIPGYEKYCLTPLPAGAAAGKIVACQRGGGGLGRVSKGAYVKAGGAVGMILYNLPLADTESDNHWLPAIHLADGTDFLAFLAAHPASLGSWPAGAKASGQGDVMAAFSSRGPGGQFLKPDITAPGVQVLAGNTPTPTPGDVVLGPPGQYYQAIAGTSMSSPHIAGSAILVKALRSWLSPGQIKSSLMTTATTDVVKEDLTTPADPFDMGAGRVDLTKAGSAPITFDESGANLAANGNNPLTADNLNVPSVNIPTMPGTVTVTRTAFNVSGSAYDYDVRTNAPTGAKITVTPDHGRIRPGQSQTFRITVSSKAAAGQYFGQVTFTSPGNVNVHLPVAFANKQGDVSLTQSCTPTTFAVGATTACAVTAQNNGQADTAVTLDSTVSGGLKITGATGGTVSANGRSASTGPRLLTAPKDAIPHIAPATNTPGGGYLPLSVFGIAPTAIGDEQNINYTLPAFVFGGKSYTRVGVDSNGYLVVGGSDSASDIAFTPQTLPDPARPNGVLAPYWSDLDGSGAPGISVGTLTDGINSWVVVQWEVHVYGDTTAAGARSMQVWLGVNGSEDISYEYASNSDGVGTPAGTGLTVGVENLTGTAGEQIAGLPTGSYRVTSVPGQPGGTLTLGLTIKGKTPGTHTLTSMLNSDAVIGTTRVTTPLTVTSG